MTLCSLCQTEHIKAQMPCAVGQVKKPLSGPESHLFCFCCRGILDGSRPCHYCRKRLRFFRSHFVCIPCQYGWKSSRESPLKPDAEEGCLLGVDLYREVKCPRCKQEATQVGFDYRVAKKGSSREWKRLAQEIAAGVNLCDKYTHRCICRNDQWTAERYFDKRKS